jgi:hypothetical protein
MISPPESYRLNCSSHKRINRICSAEFKSPYYLLILGPSKPPIVFKAFSASYVKSNHFNLIAQYTFAANISRLAIESGSR